MSSAADELVWKEDPAFARACEWLGAGLRIEEIEDRLIEEGASRETAEQVALAAVQNVVRPAVIHLLENGLSPLRVQDTLIDQGYAKEVVFRVVDEVLAQPNAVRTTGAAWGSPETPAVNPTSLNMGFRVVGGLVLALGAIFWLGNVTGAFPTIPGLGYITLLVGGVIYGMADRSST